MERSRYPHYIRSHGTSRRVRVVLAATLVQAAFSGGLAAAEPDQDAKPAGQSSPAAAPSPATPARSAADSATAKPAASANDQKAASESSGAKGTSATAANAAPATAAAAASTAAARNDKAEKSDKNDKTDKADKNEKTAKSDKSDKGDKNEKGDKSDKNDRNAKNDKNDKNDKSAKNDKNDKNKGSEKDARNDKQAKNEKDDKNGKSAKSDKDKQQEKSAPEKATADKSTADKSTSDKSAADKSAGKSGSAPGDGKSSAGNGQKESNTAVAAGSVAAAVPAAASIAAGNASANTAVTTVATGSGMPASADLERQKTAMAGLPANARRVTLNMKQLGAWGALKLRGGAGTRMLAFGVRADEEVVAAKLLVNYEFSPALIEDLSHLKVFLNGKMQMLDALPKARAAGVRREIKVDPALMTDNNELRFEFIGDYTRQCSNPLHPSIWLNVNDQTQLELVVVPRNIAPDLKYLPAPFLDRADPRPLNLSFVFAASPSFSSLRAAGMAASWFGTMAGNRTMRVTPYINELPPGNAVVFVTGSEDADGVRADVGSRLTVQNHPRDPGAKLLVVSGSNEAEMMRAARTLVLSHRTLSGQHALLTKEVEVAQRQLNDAPTWVKTDRPMKFGEMARPEELRAEGYFPEVIRLNYRVPPDIFTWKTEGAPMRLRYRATRLPDHRNSSLAIGLNNSFIDTLALNEKPELVAAHQSLVGTVETKNPSVREVNLFLPPHAQTGREQLQFGYTTDIIQSGNCEHLPPNNFVGAIDVESTVDFSKFPRFVALPNLAYFTRLGYPFTRYADLSETSVVLPESPGPAEIKLFLTTLTRLGESTGYPATRYVLAKASEVSKSADKDLLIISTARDQAEFSGWAKQIPMSIQDGVRTIREPQVSWRPTFRWEQQDIDPMIRQPGEISLTGPGTLVAMMGFESPLKSDRSAVMLYADKSADLKRIDDLLVDPEKLAAVSGDFVVVGEKALQSTKASATYFLGDIPWMTKLRWLLAEHPILVALASLLMATLMAAALYRPLAMITGRRRKAASPTPPPATPK